MINKSWKRKAVYDRSSEPLGYLYSIWFIFQIFILFHEIVYHVDSEVFLSRCVEWILLWLFGCCGRCMPLHYLLATSPAKWHSLTFSSIEGDGQIRQMNQDGPKITAERDCVGYIVPWSNKTQIVLGLQLTLFTDAFYGSKVLYYSTFHINVSCLFSNI